MHDGELKKSIAQEIWTGVQIMHTYICVCSLSNLHGTVDAKALSFEKLESCQFRKKDSPRAKTYK